MKAEEIERIKELLPTELGSAEIRGTFAAEILQRSVFSARMASAPYLAKVRDVCTELISGTINEATARARLMDCLAEMGHSPNDEGGLKNPASVRRLNLILDTQRQMATSAARISEQTEATVNQFPAWQLARLETRAVPRADWPARWNAAGEACGWEGALERPMIALKSSPIWAALGAGVGGFKDTLGNPYPPFAYSSGLDWVDVSRETCIRLGLINADEDVSSPERPSLSPGERDIKEALDRYGFNVFAKDIETLGKDIKLEDLL